LAVIYTDGITEARSVRGEQFGEARLLSALHARQSQERASVTLANILNKLDEFTGAAPTSTATSRASAASSPPPLNR
jgi:serine phosphatase RsbU (regulator of sigma subunit)